MTNRPTAVAAPAALLAALLALWLWPARQTSHAQPKSAGRAERAAELARAERDPERAEILLRNAVRQAPGDFRFVQLLAERVLSEKPARPDALDRLTATLAESAVAVDPDDVAKVLALVDRASAARPAGDAPSWATLADVSVAALPNEDAALRHLERLQRLLEQMPDSAKDRPAALRALAATRDAADAFDRCRQVDAHFARLEVETELAGERAVAVVQAAEALLPRFWGSDVAQVPAALKARIDGYPKRVSEWVAKIGAARAKGVLEQIAKLRGEIDATRSLPEFANTRWQAWIERAESRMRAAQALMTKLTTTEALDAAQAEYRQMEAKLVAWRTHQFDAYQQHCLKKCKDIFDNYNGSWRVDSQTALNYLKNNGLLRVDPSLLSTDMRRCFDDLMGKLLGEMKPHHSVEAHEELSKTKKLKLEDF